MAKYPIKMLKDEEGTPFVPLVSTEALRTPEGETIEEKLEKKLEVSNIIAGTDISLSVDGNNITINNASKGVLIDNLDTETSGVGSLDAHQGKILKDSIPEIVDNLTTVSGTKGLSAYQGYLLNHKVVPTGGTTGQVLKKSSNDDHALEWGDAADPNAISGDGSIKKIVELTYQEYKDLEAQLLLDPETEYHIPNTTSSYIDINGIPIGGYIPYATSEPPATWLLCDGSAVSRTIYKDLYSVIGTVYGSGDGSTTFNLPNLKGKIPVGRDPDQSEFILIGKTGGSKYLQSHNHSITSIYDDANYNQGTIPGNDQISIPYDGGTITRTQHVNSTGDGNSGNLQPYIVCDYIIKAQNIVSLLSNGKVINNLDSTSEIDAPSVYAVRNKFIEQTDAYWIGWNHERVTWSGQHLWSDLVCHKGKNILYNSNTIKFTVSGLYNIHVNLHYVSGISRSFVSLNFDFGGDLCPSELRSDDTENLVSDANYTSDWTIYIKSGCIMSILIYNSPSSTLYGTSNWDNLASGLQIYKIANYIEE